MSSPPIDVTVAGAANHAPCHLGGVGVELSQQTATDRAATQDRRTTVRHREFLVFGACSLIMAAHILVDAYIDLRPGTAAGDHPVSGTVPVATLAALVYAFRRLRAGTAATVALLLGLTAVLAGIFAPVGNLFVDRQFTASPITGALATVAAAVLVGLGATMLIRARRLDGPKVRRWGRRAVGGVLFVVLATVISLPISSGFVSANRTGGFALDAVELGPGFETLTLETADGLRLAAAYRPSTNGAAIILFPGRKPAHEEMLADHGYGVLLFEPRGRHDSEGDVNHMGWRGQEDVETAVRYLQSRADVQDGRIGGLGMSIGGILLLQTAADEPAIRAVVSEGAGSHLDEPVAYRPLNVLEDLAVAVFTNSLPPAPVEDVIADIAPRPVMLIWAPNDGREFSNPGYYERAGDPKTIWAIPEGGHTGGLAARPAEYEARVMQFFDRALSPPIDSPDDRGTATGEG